MKQILEQLKIERDNYNSKVIKLNQIINELEEIGGVSGLEKKSISKRKSIEGKMKELAKSGYQPWSDEEVERVAGLYSTTPTREIVEILKEEFGTIRTLGSINVKMSQNKVHKAKVPINVDSTRKHERMSTKAKIWDDEKTEFVRQLVNLSPTISDQEIADAIKEEYEIEMDEDRVKSMRNYYNIKLNKKKKWTPEVLERIKELMNSHTNSEIAEIIKEEFPHIKTCNGQDIAVNMGRIGLVRAQQIRNPRTPSKTPEEKLQEEIEKEEEIKQEIKFKRENYGLDQKAVKIIEQNYVSNNDEDIRKIIGDKTGTFYKIESIQKYRKQKGLEDPTDPKVPLDDGIDLDEDVDEEADDE